MPKKYRNLGDGIKVLRVWAETGLRGPLLHVQDEKSKNTDAGTFSSGARRTRDLNTVKTDDIKGASLASNQITLPAGTYWVECSAPTIDVNRNQAYLRDTTNSSDLIVGSSEFTRSGGGGDSTQSLIIGRITLSAETVLEIQHECETSQVNIGFGQAANFDTEVYAIGKFWKVA